MDTKDYRIITTIASSIAMPCHYNGKIVYELDLKKFINALDNIYPEARIPVSINGEILNPKPEDEAEE